MKTIDLINEVKKKNEVLGKTIEETVCLEDNHGITTIGLLFDDFIENLHFVADREIIDAHARKAYAAGEVRLADDYRRYHLDILVALDDLAQEIDVEKAIEKYKAYILKYNVFSRIDQKITEIERNEIGKKPFYIQ